MCIRDRLGTTTAKPTARWVFQFFAGIHVLLIDSCREVILNCNEYHYQLLRLLGERYVRLYANSGQQGCGMSCIRPQRPATLTMHCPLRSPKRKIPDAGCVAFAHEGG